jgi:CubicO group peptidase (beta-lactamase class C family)
VRCRHDLTEQDAALLHRPLVRDPGTAFAYDTGSYYFLSAVITHATGMPASEYARRHLLRPTGIEDVACLYL